ncbi:4-coumarate--CoA ligase 1-like [Schistocerca piceifrons]|uniref:4-coumarate--CoA ligase 1-like n=1 Tax=Schistocerca piceifrons TaxID=274613 RepID=UPI001F5F3EBF|nr:4-coumarate--CoA ligase 1-like [Schistocerca piceifrons]
MAQRGLKEDELILRGPPLPPRPLGQTLWDRLLNSMLQHGDATAQIDADTGARQSYREILQSVGQLVKILDASNFKPGDTVVICSENNLQFCVPLLACLQAGYVCAPLNPAYTTNELQHVLKLTKPRAIFYSRRSATAILDAAKKITSRCEIYCCIDEELDSFLLQSKKFHKSVKNDVKSSDTAFILTSSGTTGLPKGVALSHDNFLVSLACLRHPDFNPDEEYGKEMVAYLPFFHAFGLHIMIGCFDEGVAMIIMTQFDIDTFLQLIQDYKVQSLALVPPIVALISYHPSVANYDLSSVRRVGCGAAPLGSDLQEAFKKRLPSVEEITQAYGLTEATLMVTRIPPGKNKMGSSGVAAPGIEVKVIDTETGRSLGPYKQGEILCRGSAIMKGYIGDEKATAATIDSDGWLHTGDVGYYDNDGYFFIVDRIKELIKYKGFQVAPAELEGIIVNHPAVYEVAVIGVPDKIAGELPKAFVVQQAPVTEQEIIDYVAKQVSSHKQLRGGVEFVNEIPKTSTGKILRRELRRLKSKL